MGAILAENIKNKQRPSVALLNIGEGETKGLDNIKQAAKMLYNCDAINYIGYVEGNNMFNAKADVVVCDGFAGNVALKTSEGTAKLITSIMREAFSHSIASKISTSDQTDSCSTVYGSFKPREEAPITKEGEADTGQMRGHDAKNTT